MEKWKTNISIKCKEISSKYNAETQSKAFKKAFQEVVNQL